MSCQFFIICPEFVTENLFGIVIKRGKWAFLKQLQTKMSPPTGFVHIFFHVFVN